MAPFTSESRQSDESDEASPASGPYLPPELLLKVFHHITDRKPQLALRGVCTQFRHLIDRHGVLVLSRAHAIL